MAAGCGVVEKMVPGCGDTEKMAPGCGVADKMVPECCVESRGTMAPNSGVVSIIELALNTNEAGGAMAGIRRSRAEKVSGARGWAPTSTIIATSCAADCRSCLSWLVRICQVFGSGEEPPTAASCSGWPGSTGRISGAPDSGDVAGTSSMPSSSSNLTTGSWASPAVSAQPSSWSSLLSGMGATAAMMAVARSEQLWRSHSSARPRQPGEGHTASCSMASRRQSKEQPWSGGVSNTVS
ncbi:uncharacterized protein LOC142924246 [Petromyzon marinus]|uniref:uncharacterized protein LOC142924245 n=1 Tax=Petromyzon marinus TaxID=7757 RepID=UPI003F72CFEF